MIVLQREKLKSNISKEENKPFLDTQIKIHRAKKSGANGYLCRSQWTADAEARCLPLQDPMACLCNRKVPAYAGAEPASAGGSGRRSGMLSGEDVAGGAIVSDGKKR